MDERVKKQIENHCKAHGWPCQEKKDYIETLTDSAKFIQEVSRDEHRWYFLITKVVQLDGMFIQYEDIDMKSEDCSAEDAGLEHDMDAIVEVEPKEKTVTVYVPTTPATGE